MDTPPEQLAHLRLHNGTIWRWNRPLIGFDPNGEPHIRIEHRVPAAGPSMQDVIANAAFYFGALTAILGADEPLEATIPNRMAARNFYACARSGLDAEIDWNDKSGVSVKSLILDNLLPLARQGLASIGYDQEEANHWLDIIRTRTKTAINGATWQRQWVAKHGPAFDNLVLAYREQQATNKPVHTWRI
jgi:gamma-glutamyl:cysteine ligase YbdK (ATP-grasp superfamily)